MKAGRDLGRPGRPGPGSPVILTSRLVLRLLEEDDAAALTSLPGSAEIAARSPEADRGRSGAGEWIRARIDRGSRGLSVSFAALRREDRELLGLVEVLVDRPNARGEIWFQMARERSNMGFCTEAVAAVLAYCFESLALERVYARVFGDNRATQRVLEKAGMVCEGVLRSHVCVSGRRFDEIIFGALRDDMRTGLLKQAATGAPRRG